MAERQSVRVGVVVVVVIVVVVGAVVVVVVVVAATSDQAAAQLRGLEQAWGATSVLEVPTRPFSNKYRFVPPPGHVTLRFATGAVLIRQVPIPGPRLCLKHCISG